MEMNQEYLNIVNSDSYKLGQLLYLTINNLESRHFGAIKNEFCKKIRSYRIRRISHPNILDIQPHSKKTNARIAVYTVIYGAYDTLSEPIVIDPQCDYYYIGDQHFNKPSIWKYKEFSLPYEIEKLDGIYKNRYCKMHPFSIFPDYEYSIYLDGNIILYGYPSDLLEFINNKSGFALHNMANRDCIYAEAIACKILKKGHYELIKKQVKRYRKDNFPEHFGVYECPIVFRQHSSICKEINQTWWQEFRESGGRDQLCLPYVIWKKGLNFEDVGLLGNDVRRNPYFRQVNHLKR